LRSLTRLLGTSPSGIGYTIERAELTGRENKYRLIDSFTEIPKDVPLLAKCTLYPCPLSPSTNQYQLKVDSTTTASRGCL
jgi:hypothetical protein